MNDTAGGKRWEWVTWPRIILAVILYVLSIGPAWWLAHVTGLRLPFLIFYAPLWLLTASSKVVRELVTWYLNLWHV
ncbi:MAG: hypothetical protein AB7O26_12085 [Planctomycetaceae bacterium]